MGLHCFRNYFAVQYCFVAVFDAVVVVVVVVVVAAAALFHRNVLQSQIEMCISYLYIILNCFK